MATLEIEVNIIIIIYLIHKYLGCGSTSSSTSSVDTLEHKNKQNIMQVNKATE